MSLTSIDWVDSGDIAVLRLSNPPLNLLTVEIFRRLRADLGEIRQHPRLRALVITGDGPEAPFSAGSDMREFSEITGSALERKVLIENLALLELEELSVPTIAAIERFALGGGFELALACDLRVVSEDARLALPEPTIGGVASNGTQRLTRLIGSGRASRMTFLAEEFDGASAVPFGLAEWAARAGQSESFALGLARRIAKLAPGSIRLAKDLIRNTRSNQPESFLESIRAQEAVFEGAELKLGVEAFFQKKTADFRGETP